MRRALLAPLVPAYRLALLLRELRLRAGLEPVRRLSFPVVSIGNLSTGGAGKTPLTIALAKALDRRGLRVDVLSRGYGRRSQRPARVDPDGTAQGFGDEPLLIARQTGVPVYVASQRFQAGLMAEASLTNSATPAVHLLDDGFQHRQLHRDVDILLLNRHDLTDRLLPAGNLREPLKAARRAGVIAIPTDEPQLGEEQKALGWAGSVWRLRRRMEVPPVDGAVAAFCGIALPGQFFAGLASASLRLVAQIAFPDHFRYTPRDLDRLLARARAAGAAALITTEKDLVRLGVLASVLRESMPLLTARLSIEIDHEDDAMEWLIGRLCPARPHLPL